LISGIAAAGSCVSHFAFQDIVLRSNAFASSLAMDGAVQFFLLP